MASSRPRIAAEATTSSHAQPRATGSAPGAAASRSGAECTTVIQSSLARSGSSAVSNVSPRPLGSSDASGSALATAISASVIDTSVSCGSSAKASTPPRFIAASSAAAPTISRAPSSPTGAKPAGSTRCSNDALRRHGRQSPPSTTRRARPDVPFACPSRQETAASGKSRAGITRLSRPFSIHARLAAALRIAAATRIHATALRPQEMVKLCTITVRQPAIVDGVQVVTVCSSRPPTMR